MMEAFGILLIFAGVANLICIVWAAGGFKRFVGDRRIAVARLYRMHRTEWSFGWHDPNPNVRRSCRWDWPPEVLGRVHRGEIF